MKSPVKSPAALLAPVRALTFANVAEGAEGLVISDLARALAREAEDRALALIHVARDSQRAAAFTEALAFAAPDIEILDFPGWDCQP